MSFLKMQPRNLISIFEVAERKDGVLEILLKTEEDVLDDKNLVVALKEAKAKVFEILNDLNLEKKNQKNLEVCSKYLVPFT